jgi:plasmid stabilization system protein ParE
MSRAARTDIKQILAVSLERWGEEGADRYRALLTAALRAIRPIPQGR